jgi:hypothetical protein
LEWVSKVQVTDLAGTIERASITSFVLIFSSAWAQAAGQFHGTG